MVSTQTVRELKFPFAGVMRCTVMDLSPGEMRLVKLVIAPEMQGRGVGTRVIRELKREGRVISLVAYPDDPNRYDDCRRFYARQGFVEDDGTGDFFWYP